MNRLFELRGHFTGTASDARGAEGVRPKDFSFGDDRSKKPSTPPYSDANPPVPPPARMFIANYFFKTVDHQFRFSPPSHEDRSGPSAGSRLYGIPEDASRYPSRGEGEGENEDEREREREGENNSPGRRLSLHQVTDSAGSAGSAKDSDSTDSADSAEDSDSVDSAEDPDSADSAASAGVTDSTGNIEGGETREENDRLTEWSEDRAALVVMQLRLRALEARVAFLSESFAMLRDGREAASGDKSKKKRRIDEAPPRQYSFGEPGPVSGSVSGQSSDHGIPERNTERAEECAPKSDDADSNDDDCPAHAEGNAPNAQDNAASAEDTDAPLHGTTPPEVTDPSAEDTDAPIEDTDIPGDDRLTVSDDNAPPVDVKPAPCDCD